jgi:hypothetical protein
MNKDLYSDLERSQTLMQSVPIATNVEFVSRSWQGVPDITLCDKVCQ